MEKRLPSVPVTGEKMCPALRIFKDLFYSFVCRGKWVGECRLKPQMGKCPPKPEERIRPLESKLHVILSQAMCTL